MKNLNFKQIEKIIENAHSVLAVSHSSPDGDAVGSLAAFGFYLKKIKKPHRLLCVSEIPETLKFIPGASRIKSKHPKNRYDLIVGFDYGSMIQLGIDGYLKKYPKTPILIFDHHLPGKEKRADFGIIDSSYSSAVEILYDYFKAVGFKIDAKIARALTVGILSDTGFFRYAGNFQPLATVVELSRRLKIKPIDIADALNGQIKTAAMKLLGEILRRVKHHRGGDFMYSWVTRKELDKHHLSSDDLYEAVSYLNRLQEGKFALFLTEKSEGKVRGSLRGRPDKGYDVAKLAMRLGGGGHKYAAGFRFKGSIDAAVKIVAKYAKNG